MSAIRCESCGREHDSSAHSCVDCGAQLPASCANCGAAVGAEVRFCSQCGTQVAGRVATPPEGPAVEELRPLTVAFCDLVGSTELGQRLDPEDLREVLAAYHETCKRAIQRFEGHIAQYLGDGVLAYFGFPAAHEDDAERAIRAALEIQRLLAGYASGEHGPVQARIGIHSGSVLMSEVGERSRAQTLALGDTLNVAARVQAEAPAGSVAISDATRRLAPGRFVTRHIGDRELKGVDGPVSLHLVEAGGRVGSRPELERGTPLAGREEELEQLRERWRRAAKGQGHAVGLRGEPGIGKSRLLRALREELAGEPHWWLDLRCSPYSAGSPFQPLIDSIQDSVAFAGGDSPDEKLAKLEDALADLPGLPVSTVIPYVAGLLGLPPSPRFPLEQASPEVNRERTLSAMVSLVLALESQQPVVLACEDLQWCDPSTLELIGALVDRVPTTRLLVLLTFRPDFEALWLERRAYVSELTLTQLRDAEIRAVVASMSEGLELPPPIVDEIVERTDGVPLFVEEVTRSVLDSGLLEEREQRLHFRGRAADVVVPSTLQGSLMARLDRLSAAKAVAQLAATIGREFSAELIEEVAELEPAAIRRALAQLVDAEILFRRGSGADSEYVFKHALLQDTAYESQPRRRRRELHARIVEVLERRFPDKVEDHPDRVASHAERGGLTESAVEYYARAGQRAANRPASAEALEYFRNALDLLDGLPEGESRDAREVGLRLAQLGPLTTRGYNDPECVACCQRIEALCERLPAGPARLPGLLGLAIHNFQRSGDHVRAGVFAHRALEIAEPLGIPLLAGAANIIVGTWAIGNESIPVALRHLHHAEELAATAELPPPSDAYDFDLLLAVRSALALALVLDGRTADARDKIEEALAHGRSLGHVFSLTSALTMLSTAFYFLDDVEQAEALASECLERLAGLGFHDPESGVLVVRGWARAMRGDLAGVEELEQGVDLGLAAGAAGGVIQINLRGAEACHRAGDPERVAYYLDEAEKLIERTGERAAYGWQVPMYRAEFLLDAQPEQLERAGALARESFEGQRDYASPWMQLRSAILLGRAALATRDRVAAAERIEALLARMPQAADEPRARLARGLVSTLRG